MNIVIKIGGATGIEAGNNALAQDVFDLLRAEHRVTIVHGGSDAATTLAEQVGHPARFATSPSGHVSRLTDARTLEVFTMATALVNRNLVGALQATNVSAVGLSGLDGRLLEARAKGPFRAVEKGRRRIVRGDLTGSPMRANTTLLESLQSAGHVPVIAPLAIDAAGSQALNVDGDRAAALIARSLDADVLIILTAVPGVLAKFPDESTLIEHIPPSDLDETMNLVDGRMKKKILAAQEALAPADGAGSPPLNVIIAAANVPAPISAALRGAGTVIGQNVLAGAH